MYVRCCWPSYCSPVGHGIKALRGRLRRGSFRALSRLHGSGPFARASAALRGLDTAPLSLRLAPPLGAPTRAQRAAQIILWGWAVCRFGRLRFRCCGLVGGRRRRLGGWWIWWRGCSRRVRRRGARVFPLVGACFGPSCGRGSLRSWRRRSFGRPRSRGLRSPLRRRWRGVPSGGGCLRGRSTLGTPKCRGTIRRFSPLCWLLRPLGGCSLCSLGRFPLCACGKRAVAPVRSLAGFLVGASVVGFAGSRVSGGPLCVAARGACAAVPPGVPVAVGCASGVDAVVRSAFPRATVFAVSSGRFGSGRGAFARRSAALVSSLAPGGVLVVLPLGPCPGVVSPSPVASRCWCGGGSGSWASAAFALGLGLPVALWAPAGVPWFVSAACLGGGWWGLR